MRTSISKQEIIEAFRPFHPERIILFGSQAREDQDEASDVDVIVVYRSDKQFLERLKEMYLAWDIAKSVDILPYTPEEFERMKEESHFVKQACRGGVTIYERE